MFFDPLGRPRGRFNGGAEAPSAPSAAEDAAQACVISAIDGSPGGATRLVPPLPVGCCAAGSSASLAHMDDTGPSNFAEVEAPVAAEAEAAEAEDDEATAAFAFLSSAYYSLTWA